jgi:hypothetical protein
MHTVIMESKKKERNSITAMCPQNAHTNQGKQKMERNIQWNWDVIPLFPLMKLLLATL